MLLTGNLIVFIIYHAGKGRLKSVNSFAVIMLRHAMYTHCCAKFQNWASGNMKEAQSLTSVEKRVVVLVLTAST